MTVAISEPLDSFDVDLPPGPYPGLRPFEKHEWAVFFGRERMIDETIERLVRRQFIVVHGDSGCGKSSLIKAGVFARLEQEYARSGVTWRTAEMQPRVAPLETLALTLAALDRRAGDRPRIMEFRRALNFGAEGPRRVAEMMRRDERDHLCLLLDQFEELFAFARRGGRDEASQFVQFFVSLVKAPPAGLCAIATMRSEFLGACAQFPGLAEAVNEVQYLLPRMAAPDLVRAIREPAPAYNGHVSKDLAQRLIADAGGTQDELPLIQHGLMVLYQRKVPADARVDPPAWRLELSDYTSTSLTLSELLSGHADEIAGQAEPDDGRIVQRLFRALTEINADGQAIRRPQSLRALLRVTGADEPTLREQILRPFRTEGASFLRPYGDGPIGLDDIIDISHEALIRSWRRIADATNGWLAREFQDGLVWKSLLVQTEIFEREASNVLSPATAVERERWLRLHNAAWAERYGGGWERVTRLVGASVAAAKQQEAAARLTAKRERTAAKRQLALIAAVALLLSVFLSYSLYQNRQTSAALSQAYNATAGLLWNRLDFSGTRATDDELNALWAITSGRQEERVAFLEQLSADPERAARFGRRPAPVARAVGLQWPPDRASSAFAAVLSRVGTVDPGQLTRVGLSAYTLGGLMTAEEAQAALPATKDAFFSQADPNRSAAVVHGLQALAPSLSVDDADSMLAAVLAKLGTISSAGANTAAINRHVLAGAALARRVTPDRARAALGTLTELRGDRPVGAESLIDVLVNRLAPEQVRQDFLTAVDRLKTTKTGGQGATVALIGRKTAERLSEADARTVFPQWLGGFSADSASDRAANWAEAGTPLIPRLTGEQLRALYDALVAAGTNLATDMFPLMRALGRQIAKTLPVEDVRPMALRLPPEADRLISLGNVLRVHLGVHGTAGERTAALKISTANMSMADGEGPLAELTTLTLAIIAKLDAPQALRGLREALEALANESDDTVMTALGKVVLGLTDRLTAAEAPAALEAVFSEIPNTPPAGVPFLRQSAEAMLRKTTGAQQQKLVSDARAVLAGGNPQDRRTYNNSDGAAVTLEALASLLAVDQIEPTLAMLLRQVKEAPSAAAEHFGAAARALAARLPPGEAQRVFEQTFMRETDDIDETTLAAIIATSVGPKLSADAGRSAAARLSAAIAKRESAPSLALFSAAISRHLTTEARVMFPQLVAALRSFAGVHTLTVLGTGVEAVAQRLPAEHARDALQLVLSAPEMRPPEVSPAAVTLSQRRATGERCAALYNAGRILLGRLSPNDAEHFAPQLLRAIAVTAVPTNEARATAAIDAVMQEWPEPQTRTTLRGLIAWSAAVPETTRWMTRLAALPVPSSRVDAIGSVVEMLKYPPVGGTPTDQLLDGLKKLDPNAPGKDAGLVATLRWIAADYPSISLQARPACPTPPSASLTCPAPAR